MTKEELHIAIIAVFVVVIVYGAIGAVYHWKKAKKGVVV